MKPKASNEAELIPQTNIIKLPRASLERLNRNENDLKLRAREFESFMSEWKKQDSESVEKFIELEDCESLEALFLGLKPATANSQKMPRELLEKYGFKVQNSPESEKYLVIYNPKEVNQVIENNPDIFTEKNNSDLAVKNTLGVNFGGKQTNLRDNYWMRFGLLMGFPREACEGFVNNNNSEVCDYLDKAFKLKPIDSVQRGFEVNPKSCNKVLDRIPSLSVDFDIPKILGSMEKLLKENIQRLLNLTKIQAPGVQWLPSGKLTQETEKIITCMKRAFDISGITKPTALFSKRVLDNHQEGLIKQEALLARVDKLKEEMFPNLTAKAA